MKRIFRIFVLKTDFVLQNRVEKIKKINKSPLLSDYFQVLNFQKSNCKYINIITFVSLFTSTRCIHIRSSFRFNFLTNVNFQSVRFLHDNCCSLLPHFRISFHSRIDILLQIFFFKYTVIEKK